MHIQYFGEWVCKMSVSNSRAGCKQDAIDALLRDIPDLWRGHYTTGQSERGISTGFSGLDGILPNGGWPPRGLVEIVCSRRGMGELQLLVPLMRALSRQEQRVLWVCPPFLPYAPALVQAGIDIENLMLVPPRTSLRNAIWSMEKALRSCRLVLAWQNGLSHRVLRRLQLAANTGNSLAVLFQRGDSGCPYSALRLQLSFAAGGREGPRVSILRARGNIRFHSVRLEPEVCASAASP